ncbi:MAG TPA: MoaD/ThiS family protein [Acidimicrobiales bacterium]|nr:MoaD/ThiS family protein [Acidimicrobiales bacterium]
MARLRLFGPAREAAGGVAQVTITAPTVSGVMAAAEAQFGPSFARVVSTSNIWLNGDVVPPDTRVNEDDEVAVIPPVSGG